MNKSELASAVAEKAGVSAAQAAAAKSTGKKAEETRRR